MITYKSTHTIHYISQYRGSIQLNGYIETHTKDKVMICFMKAFELLPYFVSAILVDYIIKEAYVDDLPGLMKGIKWMHELMMMYS